MIPRQDSTNHTYEYKFNKHILGDMKIVDLPCHLISTLYSH